MKLLVALAAVGLVGSVVAEGESLIYLLKEEFGAPIQLDYHREVGIPKAARIKAAEEALDPDGARIVGGEPAVPGQYPFFGGLIITLTTDNISVCGSSLLSNTRAVTAAHCWRTRKNQARHLTVVLGSNLLFSGGTRVTTSDVEMHANYNMITNANDVAIIRMGWVIYTDNIRNIGLASGTNQFVGTWAWAAGFGLTSESAEISETQFLSHVEVQVISNEDCRAVFGSRQVIASTLCVATTGGHGICSGDSGGPLVANNQLIGITSFTVATNIGCQHGFPAAFARVTAFASWIRARM